MELIDLYLANPFWWWVGAAVVLLVIEVASGSELFLWPALAAGTLAVLSATGMRMPLGVDLAVFAGLTIAGTLLARRVRRAPGGPDINDPLNRLVGTKGTVVAAFEHGRGRVLVEGAEWGAEADGASASWLPGDRVVVAKVLDGGRLQVKQG